ncbi:MULTISPECIES: peptidoglycan-binding protein [unclassified Streptomyces]|uniref:peptidoglycan-binding protein n=1 Tax=unclassified Streptomyces TaxID=2593676 RepID=UPI0027DE0FBC|nr:MULTISPECIES: peptidoglycan-binding protein [unclassified Streptomyces]
MISSADHKWLVNMPYVTRGSRIRWVETKDLDPSRHKIKVLGVAPWSESMTKEAGYLAGAIDCDGAVVFNKSGDSAVLFGQTEDRQDVLDRFESAVRELKMDLYSVKRGDRPGYSSLKDFTDFRIKGGLWRMISFLARVGPEKFHAVRDKCWVNRVVGKTTTVADILSVEHVGPQPVVSLETSSRTYVANGMLCHNTHGDPGALDFARILELAKASGTQPAHPVYEPFPGSAFFMKGSKPALGKSSPVFTAMGKRLVAEGCGLYKVGPGPVLGQADIASYEKFQRKLGFTGSDAKWPPGPTSWAKLKVPKV